MAFAKQVYLDAEAELLRRRTAAERAAEEARASFYKDCPEAETVRRRMAMTASGAAKAVLRGGDVRAEMEDLKRENLALQAELDRLLAAHGRTRADLEPHYACPLCGDTGYTDGHMCACHKTLLRRLAYESLNRVSPLRLSTFANFSLDHLSDAPAPELGNRRSCRRQMEKIVAHMQRYAETFSTHSGSLLLTGGTGLGKTHLSLAVASAAIEKGFGVLYGTANHFAAALEKERFAREGDGDDTARLLSECDLLILDDLGMEPRSAYTAAMFHNIVDARISQGLPTIITTNLTESELAARYEQRFVSRLLGYFDPLEFVGTDYRLQMRLHRSASSGGAAAEYGK